MTEALHTKTEILTEIAPKNLNSKKAHILKSLFSFFGLQCPFYIIQDLQKVVCIFRNNGI